jgi:hypothetical protein
MAVIHSSKSIGKQFIFLGATALILNPVPNLTMLNLQAKMDLSMSHAKASQHLYTAVLVVQNFAGRRRGSMIATGRNLRVCALVVVADLS